MTIVAIIILVVNIFVLVLITRENKLMMDEIQKLRNKE